MKKIVMFNMISIDGYFAGAGGNIDWHQVDNEFNVFAADFINKCDTAVFGRITYDLFAGFWPTATSNTSTPENRLIAQTLNSMRKIVITHNKLGTNWEHSETWQDIKIDKIRELKQQDGKNIVIYGSGTIVKQLTDLGLIDEYHLIIAPVILGGGKTLFEGNSQKQLELIEAKTFTAGNVLLKYGARTKK